MAGMLCLGLGGNLLHAGEVSVRNDGSAVAVVYNRDMPGSKAVAEHYAARRKVPSDQIFALSLPTSEVISREDYIRRLQQPLLQGLEARHLLVFEKPDSRPDSPTKKWRHRVRRVALRSPIRYLVLCYGVPLRIREDFDWTEGDIDHIAPAFRRNEASVDSELALLPAIHERLALSAAVVNPFYRKTQQSDFRPERGAFMVTRLDGPSVEVAKSLVDKAILAETTGLWGRAYFDLRGMTNSYKWGDDMLRRAAAVAEGLGYETVVNTNSSLFSAGFPMSHIALYAGWYAPNACGPFALPHVEFMPGAFAYHVYSYSAATLRSDTRDWAGPLLAKGATVTMGAVAEPYLQLTPDVGIFLQRWLMRGFTFGEAAYAAENVLSWQMVFIGDPLYRPYRKSAKEWHETLLKLKSPLIQWSHLRVVNINLLLGTPVATAIKYLKSIKTTDKSPVLEEKLASLYFATGERQPCIQAYRRALALHPSHEERIRLMLRLARTLKVFGEKHEALTVYRQFLRAFPDYPDLEGIRRRMGALRETRGDVRGSVNIQPLAGP